MVHPSNVALMRQSAEHSLSLLTCAPPDDVPPPKGGGLSEVLDLERILKDTSMPVRIIPAEERVQLAACGNGAWPAAQKLGSSSNPLRADGQVCSSGSGCPFDCYDLCHGSQNGWFEQAKSSAARVVVACCFRKREEQGQSKSIDWFSPRICSRTLMGHSDPISVLSGRQPATSIYADVRAILMMASHSEGRGHVTSEFPPSEFSITAEETASLTTHPPYQDSARRQDTDGLLRLAQP